MKKQSYFGWLLLLVFIFFTSWAFINNFYNQQVLSQHEEFLQQKANVVVRLAKDGQPIELIVQNYVLDSDERFTYLDTEGNILFDTSDENLSGDSRADRPEINAILQGSSVGRSVRISDTLNQEMLYVAVPIREDNQLVAILRVSEPTGSFLASANQMKRAIFIVYSLFCLVLGGIILHILRRRNRPIETILPVLQKMIKEPANPETIMQSSSQWKELYNSINLLSEQLSQTYQAYTASERQLYTLLNELTIGVFIIDNESNLTLMNGAMQEQLATLLAPEEQPFTETITNTQLIQMIYQINENIPVIHEEIQTDAERVLDVTLRYFKEAQQIFGVSYDLTRIRQLEKLQKDFVGNVSHELKTPVTSLIGFTETLLDGAKEDPDTLTAFLKIMQKDAYRLENLIQEIIQLSKANEINYPIQAIDVPERLNHIVKDYCTIIKQKNLTIDIEGPNHLTVVSQLELFQPICKNLIENAINYSLPDGEILINFSSQTDGLVLTFKDSGIGIAQEEQARIFERFYRVDKARARNSGGTGLGLAIVKDYVDSLGGSIHVDSHLGVGSTFTVYLPLEVLSDKES